MKRFVASLAKQKNIKPPPGYTTSFTICRAFLDEHATKRKGGDTGQKSAPKPATEAQISFAQKIAREKNIEIPEKVRTSVALMAKWIDANKETRRRNGGRKRSVSAEP